MNVLVVGGAGYIGSHMVKLLLAEGHAVTVLDNLGSGHRDAVPAGVLVQGDLANRALVDALLARGFDGVMHFAAHIQAGASVAAPGDYFRNNFANTLNLLDAMKGGGRLIFSSTAAVYGAPDRIPVAESHPCRPMSPYGKSKWLVEQALADYERAYGIRSVCLRYFNAAGAATDGSLGERHEPETHLVPLALRAAAGRRSHVDICGDDYDTPDGTCIRDYVHVSDLCAAHLLALDRLAAGAASAVYNLGNGRGFSVREVIAAAGRVTGRPVPTRIAPRRPGDPARLVADATRAIAELGWRPQRADLDTIIADAWRWEQRLTA